MSNLMIILARISLLGLVIISVLQFIKTKYVRMLIAEILLITIGYFLLHNLFFSNANITSKGETLNDIYFIIVLYFFMILGMFAQFGYSRLSYPKAKRREFDWGLFIAPIFASPIVFIPLLAALQNADIDLNNLTTAKMMVFFVAFENGFFWKEYFDNRRKEKLNEV